MRCRKSPACPQMLSRDARGAAGEIKMMTTEEILKIVMAKRTKMGLKIRLLTPDGETTLYPKDHATKSKWLADARRKGYTVLES